MRIVTNKKLARRNKKITNYLFFGTFGALILGFVLINASLFTGDVPTNLTLIAQSAVLPVLLILTVISVRMTNMWARAPRPENAIENGLKGLSNKSILYNYYHFPARHVLICPQGVFAIATRWHDQAFTFRDGKFISRRNIISKFFSLIRFDGVGKPMRDAEFARAHVQRAIDEIDPESRYSRWWSSSIPRPRSSSRASRRRRFSMPTRRRARISRISCATPNVN